MSAARGFATAKHTPGPWMAKRRDSGWDIVAPGREGYGKEIAVVLSRGQDVQEVNAHLIAAATELYEALAYWVEAAQDDPKYAAWLGKASAALAKAQA